MSQDKKEELNKIIKKLEETKDSKSLEWKRIVEANKEEFESIKSAIKEKQQELKTLVQRKRALQINNDEFEERVNKIQDELTELESKILTMRMSF
ncbi:MAG: DUF919 family protein [Candidatus Helarchaeota archaeon]